MAKHLLYSLTAMAPFSRSVLGAVHRNSSSRLRMSSPRHLPRFQLSQSGLWILKRDNR